MKKILLLSSILLVLFSQCKNSGNTDDAKTQEDEKEKKLTTRDRSITAANAYSNVFLDSTTVEDFISKGNFDEKLQRRLRSFYNARNYQFAWFNSDGFTEEARGFWNLFRYHAKYGNDSLSSDKAFNKKMDNLLSEEELSVKASDKSIINTELNLTLNFTKFGLEAFDDGYVKRKELERFVPVKKTDAMHIADSLLSKKHKDNKYFEDINEPYKLLKVQLKKYFDIAKNGGWPTIIADKKSYKLGSSSPALLTIKRRLQITGELPGADTTSVFNEELEGAVKQFQTSLGLTPTGVINSEILKQLNVPVAKKVQQILMNMGRMRWMPSQPNGNLIVVNIPEFVLHVRDGKNKVFDMNVVVGKEGHNTTMFTGDLNQVVFAPYWNVPPSIVQKEILPHMESDPSYLENQNMEIVGNEGGIPVIRQLPGEKNSLGKVKFLFPNSYNIYFHDTPSKGLFNQDKRAYSHGCIRLSDPEKMAEYLLQGDAEWPPEKISEAMNGTEEKIVRLKKAVPVFISYYTAWVDENGVLNFRDDIYGHDVQLAQKMFL